MSVLFKIAFGNGKRLKKKGREEADDGNMK